MKSVRKKALEKAYERLLAISTNQIPVDGLEELVDSKVMGYGTALHEQVHDINEYTSLLRSQSEQANSANLEFEFDRENVHQRILNNENTALFVDKFRVSISSKESSRQYYLRISALMEYQEKQWKLIHWHSSIPADPEKEAHQTLELQSELKNLEQKLTEQAADIQRKNLMLEIEDSSERVRANAMAMKSPDDIVNVLKVMSEEIAKFKLGNIGIYIWRVTDNDTVIQWNISQLMNEGVRADFNTVIDMKENPEANKILNKWKNGEKFYSYRWSGKDLENLIKEISQSIDKRSVEMFRKAIERSSRQEYYQVGASYSKGIIGLGFTEMPDIKVGPILKKMASAFNMAYKRFQDLQRAEEQAREAQIELSLERIRAQATGMQVPSDLLDIVVTMHSEFKKLGHEAHYFWHMRWLPDTYEKAMTSGDGSRIGNVMTLPRGFHENEAMLEWEQDDEAVAVFTFDAEEAIDYIDKMIRMGQFDKIDHNAPGPEDIRELGGLTFVMARTTHGEIGYSLPGMVEQPPEDDQVTLFRFARAFDLAYQRFEDLKRAEQQAYESKVEASLERVRGKAAAMSHSDDLMHIAEVMFKEMAILKINPLRFGIGLINGETKKARLWASNVSDGNALDMLGTLPLTIHPMLEQAFHAWETRREELIYTLKGQELSDYYQKIGQINPKIPNLEQLQNPETEIIQTCSFFPFKSGALYTFTEAEPSAEVKSILKRFANVFEQAHIRYDDLQVAEQQARMIREERDRLEIALRELKATQDQLVQQEKLASLGQLTAGIAHEIKNPLNFVNNFSELSVELVDEARDEVQEINSKYKVQNIDLTDLLDDIEANLKTIHKHGTRADSIVKSMLEHSRGGSGKIQPTNLNSLLREFANLSFHGMRASKTPLNVDMDFDLDDSITEVPLIAEDFSRVIINLCNNAFDAMREKLESGSDQQPVAYKPKLTFRTQASNGCVFVQIEDNGPGIPKNMMGKIMQPFYTTKKGTAGTGLGLSITNDIVKAHGGSLEVTTKEKKGTIFTIKLSAD